MMLSKIGTGRSVDMIVYCTCVDRFLNLRSRLIQLPVFLHLKHIVLGLTCLWQNNFSRIMYTIHVIAALSCLLGMWLQIEGRSNIRVLQCLRSFLLLKHFEFVCKVSTTWWYLSWHLCNRLDNKVIVL